MKNFRSKNMVFLLVIIFLFSGCATTGIRQQDIGMIIGGAVGGIAGSHIGGGSGRVAAIIAGTLLGAVVGGKIGQSMDEVDRMRTAQTLETVQTGVPARWHNPDTGVDYKVTPTRTYETTTGPCREYTIDANIGGKIEQVYGTACRQPDGSWKTVN